MKRRQALQTAAVGSAAWVLSGRSSCIGEEEAPFGGIIDTNVSLFRWPFRRLPLDDTQLLVGKLRALSVTQAWAGSFEGIFHRDLSSANERLVGECERFDELIPVGTVNPAQSGWESDFEQCTSKWNMPALRIFPNLHGYGLDHPSFLRLLARAAEAKLLLQVAVTLEDARTQPESILSPDVRLDPLPDAMRKVPGAKVQLLNLRPRIPQLDALARIPGLFFDTARADGTDGVSSLIAHTVPDRVLFGTHAPFLIPEAALIRVHEAALAPNPLRAVLRENATRLLSS